ncbi:MAG: hypothetical protein Q8P13_01255 [bacterium]|nr:hypothetical protein [bacterium]
MRDNTYLQSRLDWLWEKYFPDVEQKNKVYIKFGRAAKYRFGSIRLCYEDNGSHILINGIFKDDEFPKEIIDHTIAHEMVHYAQGFSSLRPQMHSYPHRGGVIDKELNDRGLKHLVFFYNVWIVQYKKSLGIFD